MNIIAIANHKGGCGKTATAHALGVLLSARRSVLLVDMDPQASLSGACGLAEEITPTLVDVFEGRKGISEVARPLHGRLSILPSSIQLADVEVRLMAQAGRESLLKKALSRVTGVDVVVIDCPPGLGLMTLNALVAAQGVIVPTQPQAQDLRGLSLFMRTIDAVRSELNPGLQLIGVLPTFYSAQLSHHNAALQEIRDSGLPMLTPIGRSVRVAEASAAGQSVTEYAPDNPQAKAYEELTKEINTWLRSNQR